MGRGEAGEEAGQGMKKPRAILDVEKGADPADYVGQVIRIPTKLVKQLPGQPRTYFDTVAMDRLQISIATIGQQSPATVVPWDDGSFRLRDGERRWRCCANLRIPLMALVVDARSAEEEFELSAAANMNRESHSPLEKALAMKRLRDGPLHRSIAEIARTFGVTPTTVSSHLIVLDQLPPAIVALMDPNKQGGRQGRTLQISAAVWLTALKDYPADQLRIANSIVMNSLPLSNAKRLIDHFADSKKISAGRGRERKPSDHLDLLKSGFKRLQPKLDYFRRQQQRWFDDLFAWMPVHRHDELRDSIESMITALEELRDKVASVEKIGAKRGAA
jgi:ParB/RepB/Spo0J family partition protein